MKGIRYLPLIAQCFVLNGCFSCLSSWCLGEETYERLRHPKGLGEYWEKPGMTKDSWKADWIDCGGRENGDFGPDEPIGPGDEAFQNAYKKKQSYLWSCMTKKGYQFTGKYWSFK
jgi:hypothetical protein